MASLTSFGVPTEAGDAQVVMMPKLQYRFRVQMIGFGADSYSREFTQNVTSVTRPSLTHDEITVDSYNSKVFLAGKHTWDPLTITLRDDMNGTVSAAVSAQLQKQLNQGRQSAQPAGKDYKFKMKIEQLDGSDAPVVIETWSIVGCYISNANYNENNYATSDVMSISLTVKFDNADIHGGDADVDADGTLSGEAWDSQSYSNAT